MEMNIVVHTKSRYSFVFFRGCHDMLSTKQRGTWLSISSISSCEQILAGYPRYGKYTLNVHIYNNK